MRIFVNSCGFSRQDPAHEYRWKTATGQPVTEALEEINRKRFAGLGLGDLIESDSRLPSLVFARDNGELLLFITRIASLNRIGSQGDTIYNSILLIGKNHNNLLFRRLASNLLASISAQPQDFVGAGGAAVPPNLLQDLLDSYLIFHDELGFSILPDADISEALENASDDLFSNLPVQQDNFLWRPLLGHNCFKLRQELAYELAQFTLPLSDGVIVASTGFKDPFFYKKTEAWRALSLLKEGINWQPLSEDPKLLRRRDYAEAAARGYEVPARGRQSLSSLGSRIKSIKQSKGKEA